MKQSSTPSFQGILFAVALLTIAACIGLVLYGAYAFVNVKFALVLAVVIAVAIFLQGLRKIPADPPHVALVTILGRRTTMVRGEGWQMFWFYPFLYGFVLVDVEPEDQDLAEKELGLMSTPDLANLQVRISLTWAPHWEDGRDLREFTTYGQKPGVRKILDDVVPERAREWLMSNREGPQEFRTAMAAEEEGVWVLLKAIMGESLHKIDSAIPSIVLYHFMFWYREDTGLMPEKERFLWDRSWKPIWEGYADEKRQEIRDAMLERRRSVQKLRHGNGDFVIQHLGVGLMRLNIASIRPTGGVAEAADKEAKEKLEAKADAVEAENLVTHTKLIAEQLGIPPDKAAQLFQTERDKVDATVEVREFAFSPSTTGMIQSAIPVIGGAISQGFQVIAAALDRKSGGEKGGAA